MSDEFFVAVKEFNLSWAEIRELLKNSIQFAFVEASVKRRLLADLETDLKRFERQVRSNADKVINSAEPQYRGFLCRQYKVCSP